MPMQTRRRYSRDLQADAVQLVLDQGYTPQEAADSLGIDPSILRRWIRKVQASRVSPRDRVGDTLSEGGRRS